MLGNTGTTYLIKKYFFKDLATSIFICTTILTLIILYGNLNRYNNELIRALGLSPLLFLELLSLLSPYAFSMALPFGFCLALFFSVGKWSSERQLLALESLGFKRSCWLKPLFLSSLFVAIITGFMTLYMAPTARLKFDDRKEQTLWANFDLIIDGGNEYNIDINKDQGTDSFGKLGNLVDSDIRRISLSVGEVNESTWQNLRVLLWGEGNTLLCILHAKIAEVKKFKNEGLLHLDLADVDVERTEKNLSSSRNTSNFIAFKSWDSPIELSILNKSSNSDNPKTIPFFRLIKKIYFSNDENFINSAWITLSKNLVLALSPILLSPLLIPVGASIGREEASSNLFLGVIICLAFYAMGLVLADFLSLWGLGWWLNGLLFFIAGLFKIRRLIAGGIF